ncbi:MAG: response regulator transcription factor [Chitinivibrionales bacterium]
MAHRILIVDDDPSIRKLLKISLLSEGYEAVTAENGAKALQYLDQHHADLVILDIMMPHMDGWEVCKSIRDMHPDRQVKILILTALDTPRDKLIGKDLLHANEYVTKPFDTDELLEMIRNMLA